MAEIMITERNEHPGELWMRAAAVDENGTHLSTGAFRYRQTRFGKEWIPTMTAGGIATPVEHRRGGNVRKMFSHMFEQGVKDGMVISVLHPFSFSYYRMFGYEKVADHLIIRCPLRMIDFVPRRCNFVPYTDPDTQLADLLSVYNAFAENRNLITARHDNLYFSEERVKGIKTFLYYEDGKPAAFVSFTTKKELIVNHLANGLLSVVAMGWTSISAMKEVFSFLRMYEGELDDVEFANCSLCPEVDLLLRHYTHTYYQRLPDLMVRVLNTETLLAANDYPQKEGSFTLRVDDVLESVRGVYRVSYGGGDCRVQRLEDSASAEMTMTAPVLARLVYGYEGLTAQMAACMEELTMEGSCEDFFRAFPKKPCGIYEHF